MAPEIADVTTGSTIASQWGDDIRDRTIQRYADAAERTTEHPSPTQGDLSYLADTGDVARFHSGWANIVPTGVVLPFTGTTPPIGFLLAQGQAISRTTFAALFDVVGTTYGSGDGSTTFNLPDLRQKFPLGKAASGTGSTLGSTGGTINHTHTISEVVELSSQAASIRGIVSNADMPEAHFLGGTARHTHTPGTNNPPFIALNFIIKT